MPLVMSTNGQREVYEAFFLNDVIFIIQKNDYIHHPYQVLTYKHTPTLQYLHSGGLFSSTSVEFFVAMGAACARRRASQELAPPGVTPFWEEIDKAKAEGQKNSPQPVTEDVQDREVRYAFLMRFGANFFCNCFCWCHGTRRCMWPHKFTAEHHSTSL